MYDAIVVGARCAGAPLAMLLARAGHRVALADRASFPSDTMSTHFLWQRGAARLQAWGLLGRLRARGCAPIREITFDVGSPQLVSRLARTRLIGRSGPVTGDQARLITLRHATRSRAARCRQAVTHTPLRASHNSYLR